MEQAHKHYRLLDKIIPIGLFEINDKHTDKIIKIIDSCVTRDHLLVLNKLFDNKVFTTQNFEEIRKRLYSKYTQIVSNG